MKVKITEAQAEDMLSVGSLTGLLGKAIEEWKELGYIEESDYLEEAKDFGDSLVGNIRKTKVIIDSNITLSNIADDIEILMKKYGKYILKLLEKLGEV